MFIDEVQGLLQVPLLGTRPSPVLAFAGLEGLSRPYAFDVCFMYQAQLGDAEGLLNALASLRVRGGEGQVLVRHGRIVRLHQLGVCRGLTYVQARLVPRLWDLSLHRDSRVFLGRTLPQILEDALGAAGLEGYLKARWRESYEPLPFACQYEESTLDFLSRRLEGEGIAYGFTQEEAQERLWVDDALGQGSPEAMGPEALHFQSSRGKAGPLGRVWSLGRTSESLPRDLLCVGYDERSPAKAPEGTETVDAGGLGAWYQHGERLAGAQEAQRRARLVAERLRCQGRRWEGRGSVLSMEPGRVFRLMAHGRSGLQGAYLPTDLEHEGWSEAFGAFAWGDAPDLETLRWHDGKALGRLRYANAFTAQPAGQAYRPPCRAPQPRMPGVLPAFIDSESDVPKLDPDQGGGRYRVRLPFDRSDHPAGCASAWVPLLQPSGGSTEGMHLTLRKGTPVLLTFIQGDGDRPALLGTLPDAEHPSPVSSEAPEQFVIRSAQGSSMVFNDASGAVGLSLSTPGLLATQASAQRRVVLGDDLGTVLGNRVTACAGAGLEAVLGPSYGLRLGSCMNLNHAPALNVHMTDVLRFGTGAQKGYRRAQISMGHSWRFGAVEQGGPRQGEQRVQRAVACLSALHCAYLVYATLSDAQVEGTRAWFASRGFMLAMAAAAEVVNRVAHRQLTQYEGMDRTVLIQATAETVLAEEKAPGSILLGWRELGRGVREDQQDLFAAALPDADPANRGLFVHEQRINEHGVQLLCRDVNGKPLSLLMLRKYGFDVRSQELMLQAARGYGGLPGSRIEVKQQTLHLETGTMEDKGSSALFKMSSTSAEARAESITLTGPHGGSALTVDQFRGIEQKYMVGGMVSASILLDQRGATLTSGGTFKLRGGMLNEGSGGELKVGPTGLLYLN